MEHHLPLHLFRCPQPKRNTEGLIPGKIPDRQSHRVVASKLYRLSSTRATVYKHIRCRGFGRLILLDKIGEIPTCGIFEFESRQLATFDYRFSRQRLPPLLESAALFDLYLLQSMLL